MKEINFLKLLRKQNKLVLVEPNEEVGKSYLQKSESNLISSKILLRNSRFEESISLSYYSMYNILLALLFRVGIKSENHSASIVVLNKLFGIDHSKIFFAKRERIDKQYYTDFNITKKDTEDLIFVAEDFNTKLIDFISKLTNEWIKIYRNKFKTLLK